MSIAIRSILPLLALVMLSTSWCRADDTDEVLKTANDFNAAIMKGSSPDAKKLALPAKDTPLWIDTATAMARASNHLEKAAIAKYGADGFKQLGGEIVGNGGSGAKYDDTCDVKFEGDTAILTPKPNPDTNEVYQPMFLKKVKGKWVIDIWHEGPMKQQIVDIEKKMTKLMDEVAGDIAKGKFPKVEDAKASMEKKFAELIKASQ